MRWKTLSALIVGGLLLSSTAFAIPVKKGVHVPRALTIIACTVDEYVTLPDGRRVLLKEAENEGITPVPPLNKNWHDLEWHITNGELECQRIIFPIADMAEENGAPPIPHDLSVHLQCFHAGAEIAPKWNADNRGWAVLATGCPNPEIDDGGTPDDESDDLIVGYRMPECPNQIGKLIIKCRFDPSAI